jgi:hypothetical protein
MNLTRHWAAAAVFTAISSVLLPRAEAMEQSNGVVIIEWNDLLQRNVGGPPIGQARYYAMLHIAMADAVAAIDESYRPFHAQVSSHWGASAEAAAAQAGHDVLVSLLPDTQPTADSALANQLAQIPPARALLGAVVGRKAAAAILAWRQNDGYASANPQPPAFLASTLPGVWRPTASGPYQYSEIGNVEPFGLLTPSQFLPTPYPQLESAAYAEAFNEVKMVGRAVSAARTPEQTRFAQLFAGVGPFMNVTSPFRLWSNVARDLSEQKALTLLTTARLFALTTAAISDSLQTSHYSKSLFQLGNDEAHSRIWGGIHYRFDIEASQVACAQVADYLFDNYMRPNRPARH